MNILRSTKEAKLGSAQQKVNGYRMAAYYKRISQCRKMWHQTIYNFLSLQLLLRNYIFCFVHYDRYRFGLAIINKAEIVLFTIKHWVTKIDTESTKKPTNWITGPICHVILWINNYESSSFNSLIHDLDKLL